MNRTPSRLAQAAFNTVNRLNYWSRHSGVLGQFSARAANKFTRPILKWVGANHTVVATTYGHSLIMPAEHPIAHILQLYPQSNRPLGLAAVAIANQSDPGSHISVVDVGANIGETVAIIEQHAPARCSYLCIEADRELAEICEINHRMNDRVQVKLCFVGEDEGTLVTNQDDGRANPSTKLVDGSGFEMDLGYGRLVRLDSIATEFAEAGGRLDLIKVDTEGYDFSILRSGAKLLNRYKPHLYFEWYPKLLSEIGEDPLGGFEYLKQAGYNSFVFFTNVGDYYCKLSSPNRFLLDSLASITERDNMYFDVFASTSEPACDELVKLCIAAESLPR